jgi:uncharacterized protein (PEP-CTERM system associated)
VIVAAQMATAMGVRARNAGRGLGGGFFLLPLSCALAQGTAGAAPQGLRIEPFVTLTQTISDTSGSNGRTNFITDLSPGVRVSSRRGRIQGHFDYNISGLAYSNNSSDNDIRHQLNSVVNAELIEDRLFVDAAATIAQRLISPFGLRTSDPNLPNSNQAEQRSFSISPRLRGRIAGRVTYAARVSHAVTSGGGTNAFDGTTRGASLQLSGGSGFRALSWSVVASHDESDFGANRQFEFQRVRGQLNFAVTPDLVLSLIGGQEANDLRTGSKETYDNVGGSIDWKPSKLTRIFLERERRYFGNGHSVIAEHRTARTIWRLTDRKDVTNPEERQTLAVIGTVFDLYFQQFASIEPDPVLRQVLVTNFLLSNGINPRTPIFGGFLTSAVALTRDQQLAVGWTTPRTTVTLAWQQSWTRNIESFAQTPDDFSSTTLIQQRGVTLSGSYRLTPVSALSLSASWSRSRGELQALTTTLRSLQGNWATQLNPDTTASVGLRYSKFSSASQPYTENAVVGSVSMRF